MPTDFLPTTSEALRDAKELREARRDLARVRNRVYARTERGREKAREASRRYRARLAVTPAGVARWVESVLRSRERWKAMTEDWDAPVEVRDVFVPVREALFSVAGRWYTR